MEDQRLSKLEQDFRDHRHSGHDSKRIFNKQGALTAKDDSTVNGTYSSSEQDVIENNRTRIEEIENALKAIGVLS